MFARCTRHGPTPVNWHQLAGATDNTAGKHSLVPLRKRPHSILEMCAAFFPLFQSQFRAEPSIFWVSCKQKTRGESTLWVVFGRCSVFCGGLYKPPTVGTSSLSSHIIVVPGGCAPTPFRSPSFAHSSPPSPPISLSFCQPIINNKMIIAQL
jgi:hypothetical protein